MKTVLIIDDEPQTIGVFQTALSAAGYNAILSDSSKKALDVVKQQKVDAILVDEMMEGMSGNDFIKTLKQEDGELAKIPIIVLTNFGNEDLVKEAIALGATDYVLKYQTSPVDLAAKVKDLIGE